METIVIDGKTIRIPENEIVNLQTTLNLPTREEAIQTWLADEGYIEDEEQTALQEKASAVKIDHGAENEGKKTRKKSEKPKTVKVSDEKTQIFNDIVEFLKEKYEINILTSNKMIEINLNGKNFKLNLSETRAKK